MKKVFVLSHKFMHNPRFILLFSSLISVLCFLIILPRITVPIKENKFIKAKEVNIGGYLFNFNDGKYVYDFRNFKKGLDIQGGLRVVLKADMSKIKEEEKEEALISAKEVIVRRVDLLGVSEPVIQTSKVGEDYRIIVELPGVSNTEDALSTIGQTAQLKFKQLKKDVKYDPNNFVQYLINLDYWEDTNLTGADLVGADVVFGQSRNSLNSTPEIRLKFSDAGRSKFSDIAKSNINKPIGIFLDDNSLPLSTPIVNPDLARGLTSDPVITGNFDTEEANRLSISIRAGALPVPVEILEQKTVGATLGQEAVNKSIVAGTVGVFLILIFMIYSYGRFGVFASIALVVYGLITLALFKTIPIVITLPGIAGFILSLGMAVDANILIFERIKEEIEWGKSVKNSIKDGFERAWPSIKDSNISSLITCAILFYFGTGVVRGFALTLALGILVSMYSAVYVTKALIEVFYKESK